MNVPSRYGLLRVVGWILQLLGVVICVACIIGGIALGNATTFAGSGSNILTIALVAFGVINLVGYIVRGSVLKLLDDVEQRTRANAQAIERVMRLTEVQVTSGGVTGSSTQPLPAMGDR